MLPHKIKVDNNREVHPLSTSGLYKSVHGHAHLHKHVCTHTPLHTQRHFKLMAFFLFIYFETGSHYVILTGLELAMYNKVASNP